MTMTDTWRPRRGGDRTHPRRSGRPGLADVDRTETLRRPGTVPTGATLPVAKMDVRVGGTRHVCMEMQTPDGTMRMWFTGEYREVVENERLVYTESMSDEDGNVLSPSETGMPDGHPTTTEVAVELEDVDGRTKMVMTHTGVSPDSPGRGRLDDGIQQARRVHRRTQPPVAPQRSRRAALCNVLRRHATNGGPGLTAATQFSSI